MNKEKPSPSSSDSPIRSADGSVEPQRTMGKINWPQVGKQFQELVKLGIVKFNQDDTPEEMPPSDG